MGGIMAQIPIKNDEKANEDAMAKVKEIKKEKQGNGHDST